jgi:hypothetical protein
MIDNPNGITINDTVVATWFERDRAHVALWMKDADGGQSQELIVDWWDEDVASLALGGLLDPRDWHGSAFEYAAWLGRLNPANRVGVEPVRTGWVLVHEEEGILLGWNRGPHYIWSEGATIGEIARGACVFSDEDDAINFILEDMPEEEAEELRGKLSSYELPLDVYVAGRSRPSRVSVASIKAAGLIPETPIRPAF